MSDHRKAGLSGALGAECSAFCWRCSRSRRRLRGPRAWGRGGGGIAVSRNNHLNGPLGMTIAPDGDILTANSTDGNIVETTPFGSQVATFETTAEGGGLFGLTLAPFAQGVYFVNDKENTLELLH